MTKTFILFLTIILFPFFSDSQTEFGDKLSRAALELTNDRVLYDPSYFRLDYPMGDVPADRGVCTDVIIRAYRKLGIDLQQLVHEDMRAHFSSYPNKWNLAKTDRNIDHRRVPNLMKFFERHGEILKISDDPSNYQPGDIVCWMLSGNLTHIGVVVNKKSPDGKKYQVVHNIGAGQVMEDCLFSYRIIGHYRFGG
jgi:uncharacterized protein